MNSAPHSEWVVVPILSFSSHLHDRPAEQRAQHGCDRIEYEDEKGGRVRSWRVVGFVERRENGRFSLIGICIRRI